MMTIKYNSLKSLAFDNSFIRELPADPQSANYRRQVFGACYSIVKPTPVLYPKLIAYSKEAAALLDLSEDACNDDEFVQVFSGNRLLFGMEPYAACYGGHQFGNWAGQLGDGRAINLGEVINSRSERWTLQLKGAGATPYSRNADGLAVLRSSVREFLCSEAMFHLGVPTTRALSLISTGEMVERDMFYDGNPKDEHGAIVCRLAQSFTRFGNFEIFTARNDIKTLKKLLDYTIHIDFPHLIGHQNIKEELTWQSYLKWFEEVCIRTADLLVEWMRVGFVHGVMNTDNMSALGLTIDYGPYGWLDNYDPNWTPNTTDRAGRRYRFGNQPAVAHWNLAQLANAIFPLIGDVEPLKDALNLYSARFKDRWQTMMRAKLGLKSFDSTTDTILINQLFTLFGIAETDMTLFFRKIASYDFTSDWFKSMSQISEKMALLKPFIESYYEPSQLTEEYLFKIVDWFSSYTKRLEKDSRTYKDRQDSMNLVNPKYILRNYLSQLAIDKAEAGDFSMINRLLDMVRSPYSEQPENEEFAVKRPDWARNRAGCSMLSCSS
ncbi:MAG: YdiU family protein [Desulfamplus sp.]|nr:YdiU family protein [Desulfamplus sp.]